jgi:hypothetical protein
LVGGLKNGGLKDGGLKDGDEKLDNDRRCGKRHGRDRFRRGSLGCRFGLHGDGVRIRRCHDGLGCCRLGLGGFDNRCSLAPAPSAARPGHGLARGFGVAPEFGPGFSDRFGSRFCTCHGRFATAARRLLRRVGHRFDGLNGCLGHGIADLRRIRLVFTILFAVADLEAVFRRLAGLTTGRAALATPPRGGA